MAAIIVLSTSTREKSYSSWRLKGYYLKQHSQTKRRLGLDISSRIITFAGVAMILVAIVTALTVGLTASGTSDKSPFERDEVAEFLTDINDNEGLLVAAAASGIVADGVLLLAVAAAIFVLFRDRSPLLATLSMIGLTAAATVSLLVDGSNILLAMIADDFVNGGAGDIPPGDPAVLELGRYVGMITFLFVNVLFTAAGTGLLALGLLLVGARPGVVNPPKWIGWVAIVSGASAWLAWLVVLAEPGFVFFPIQLISVLVLMISLGIWLLRHPDLQPSPM